VVDCGSLENC